MIPVWYWVGLFFAGVAWAGLTVVALGAWIDCYESEKKEQARIALQVMLLGPLVAVLWPVVLPIALLVGLGAMLFGLAKDARS